MSYRKYDRISNLSDGRITVHPTPTECSLPVSIDFVPPLPNGLTEKVEIPNDEILRGPPPPTDNESFKQVLLSGRIKVTPLERRKVTSKFYPVYIPEMSFSLGNPTCWNDNGGWIDNDPTQSSFYEYGDVIAKSSWNRLTLPNEVSRVPDEFIHQETIDWESEINELRSSIVSKHISTYDLLTELSEVNETYDLLRRVAQAARSPRRTLRKVVKDIAKFRTKLKKAKKVADDFGDSWLQYRYGIMPIFYSASDILTLVRERDDIYKTDRLRKDVEADFTLRDLRGLYGVYSYTGLRTKAQIRVMGKSRYQIDSAYDRIVDQILVNPALTLYENVPLSFVIDWFLNIGEWLQAHYTSALFAPLERVFVQSIKKSTTAETGLTWNLNYKESKVRPPILDRPEHTISTGDNPVIGQALYARIREDSYVRSLFVPTDVKVQVAPFLNWKRYLDSISLINGKFKQSIRSLK